MVFDRLVGHMLERFSILYQLFLFIATFLPLYSTSSSTSGLSAASGTRISPIPTHIAESRIPCQDPARPIRPRENHHYPAKNKAVPSPTRALPQPPPRLGRTRSTMPPAGAVSGDPRRGPNDASDRAVKVLFDYLSTCRTAETKSTTNATFFSRVIAFRCTSRRSRPDRAARRDPPGNRNWCISNQSATGNEASAEARCPPRPEGDFPS